MIQEDIGYRLQGLGFLRVRALFLDSPGPGLYFLGIENAEPGFSRLSLGRATLGTLQNARKYPKPQATGCHLQCPVRSGNFSTTKAL